MTVTFGNQTGKYKKRKSLSYHLKAHTKHLAWGNVGSWNDMESKVILSLPKTP